MIDRFWTQSSGSHSIGLVDSISDGIVDDIDLQMVSYDIVDDIKYSNVDAIEDVIEVVITYGIIDGTVDVIKVVIVDGILDVIYDGNGDIDDGHDDRNGSGGCSCAAGA